MEVIGEKERCKDMWEREERLRPPPCVRGIKRGKRAVECIAAYMVTSPKR